MRETQKIILIVPPVRVRAALETGLTLAHRSYRLGNGAHLFRSNLPVNLRGGLMVLEDTGFDGQGEAAVFCREVLRECTTRGFNGVICNFESRGLPLQSQIVSELGALLSQRGWPLYVTESYGACSERAKVLISSALSGGSLQTRLEEAIAQYGVQRVALAVERVAADFFLPSPTGQGTPLSQEELKRRLEEQNATVFFSNELCAHYFTYMSKQNGAHFILFDDAGSIRKKLQIARNLDIQDVIFLYEQVEDLLPTLLSGKKPAPAPRSGNNRR